MKRTPTLEFVYDESIDRGMRISELLDDEASERRHRARAACSPSCAPPTSCCSPRTRTPTATRSGSLLAMHWILEQLGKDSLMYMSPDEFPLP